MSQNDQIDYKYDLKTHLAKSRGLTKCHNKSDVSNSKCFAVGIHRRLKAMIQWRVSRKIVHLGNCRYLKITIY